MSNVDNLFQPGTDDAVDAAAPTDRLPAVTAVC
ncbi:hypothetical protein ABIB82_001267 [Bradyrhizobium sp. i1.8.4]